MVSALQMISELSVEDYIKSDRQWPRVHRIAHAKFRWASAPENEKEFWEKVIKANVD